MFSLGRVMVTNSDSSISGAEWIPPRLRRQDQICVAQGCERIVVARGCCGAHLKRLQRYGDPNAGGPLRKRTPGPRRSCSFEGCDKPFFGRGVCRGHYAQLKRGQELRELKKRRPNGEGFLNSEGYWMVTIDGRQVFEHRLVMSEILGRDLLREETVHHKNGDRSDNRPENLELWISSQPSGQRVEDLVAWAKEIIASYGDLDLDYLCRRYEGVSLADFKRQLNT